MQNISEYLKKNFLQTASHLKLLNNFFQEGRIDQVLVWKCFRIYEHQSYKQIW